MSDMPKIKLDAQKLINYWRETSDYDLKVAEHLFQAKDYSYCLFMGHLSLEKILKGLAVEKTRQQAPYTHNLVYLTQKAKLNLSLKIMDQLAEINEFNLEARYPEARMDFYKKCTKEYTEEYFKIIKDIHLCLKRKFPKK